MAIVAKTQLSSRKFDCRRFTINLTEETFDMKNCFMNALEQASQNLYTDIVILARRHYSKEVLLIQACQMEWNSKLIDLLLLFY